jgi:hypothetical protein
MKAKPVKKVATPKSKTSDAAPKAAAKKASPKKKSPSAQLLCQTQPKLKHKAR